MKINLSKEHIEKGCGLAIEGYSCVDGQLWSYLHKGFVSESDDPLYRDFLQLVIEGINKNTNCSIIQQESKIIICIDNDRIRKNYYISDTSYPIKSRHDINHGDFIQRKTWVASRVLEVQFIGKKRGMGVCWLNGERGKEETFTFDGYEKDWINLGKADNINTITEAKEKAIACVFNNMEKL